MTESVANNELIDRYFAIRRLLARGGMSDIYEAEHVVTGRRLVVKVLPEDKKSNHEFRTRLLREAKFLERSRGEGVVEVITAGECSRFGVYVAMEQLVGRPLDGLIVARGSLRPEEAIRVFLPLANTLSRLHENNFVHRDVKPANVFVALNNISAKYSVKLLDFGVSTQLDENQEPKRKLTFAGELLGTVEYMSPEQVLTQHDKIDARADVFSFGASLFEALTGVLPLGNDPHARFKAVQTAAVAPSLTQLVPGINPALAELVAQMLAYDKDARPASMREVAAALKGKAAPIAIPSLGETKETPALSPVMPPKGAEQRKNARAAYITAVRLTSNGESQDCRSEDISQGGMLLLAKGKRQQGEVVQLKFSLPISGQIVQTSAVLRWQKESNGRAALGLEWIDPTPVLQREIVEYLRFMKTPSSAGA